MLLFLDLGKGAKEKAELGLYIQCHKGVVWMVLFEKSINETQNTVAQKSFLDLASVHPRASDNQVQGYVLINLYLIWSYYFPY